MEHYLFEQMAEVEAQHWWFAARREILAAVIARLPLPTPAAARIVEIGCGTGGNLPMLGAFGRVQAMEADDFALRRAQACGVRVLAGRLGDPLPFSRHSQDLVCLFDVLEHVEDDVGGLAAAGSLLRTRGRVLVTVPAYQWLFGPHDAAHHHYRRYTAGHLAQVAQEAGLAVERIGYFNTFLFPLVVAGRAADRLTGRQSAPGAEILPAWANTLLRFIFASEKAIVARCFLPFGTSAIAVLKHR